MVLFLMLSNGLGQEVVIVRKNTFRSYCFYVAFSIVISYICIIANQDLK